MPHRSRVLRVVALGLITLALLVVAAEAAYRWRIARNPSGAVQLRYYRHARLERALVRGVDYGGRVHINRHGLRGPEFDATREPGTTRVMVVGASTTFDPCASSDAETWPARLEHWLAQLAPGRAFEVINAGVPGFPMVNHVIRLHTELYVFDPDAIVVYAGHGIVSAADADSEEPVDATPNAAATVPPWDPWLREHSRLYERLRPQSRASGRRARLTDADWARAVDNAAGDFDRDLTSFTAIARSMGATVALVEIQRATANRHPSEFTDAERAAWQNLFATPPEVVWDGYQRFRSIWASVAERMDATFIPAEALGIAGAEHYCDRDPIHFNRAGSEAMARRLGVQLLARGIV